MRVKDYVESVRVYMLAVAVSAGLSCLGEVHHSGGLMIVLQSSVNA